LVGLDHGRRRGAPVRTRDPAKCSMIYRLMRYVGLGFIQAKGRDPIVHPVVPSNRLASTTYSTTSPELTA
jgi:hypothetical protein